MNKLMLNTITLDGRNVVVKKKGDMNGVLERKMNIVTVDGTSLIASCDNYYLFISEVNSLSIVLETPSDTTHISKIVAMFRTGDNPALSVATDVNGVDIVLQDGFNIAANSTYELNAIFNGVMWVIATIKLNQIEE